MIDYDVANVRQFDTSPKNSARRQLGWHLPAPPNCWSNTPDGLGADPVNASVLHAPIHRVVKLTGQARDSFLNGASQKPNAWHNAERASKSMPFPCLFKLHRCHISAAAFEGVT